MKLESELMKSMQCIFTNGLNLTAFPSLEKFETDVVKMVLNLICGDIDKKGIMTSRLPFTINGIGKADFGSIMIEG